MRAALTPNQPHMNVAVVLLAMAGATAALFVLSLRTLCQRVVV